MVHDIRRLGHLFIVGSPVLRICGFAAVVRPAVQSAILENARRQGCCRAGRIITVTGISVIIWALRGKSIGFPGGTSARTHLLRPVLGRKDASRYLNWGIVGCHCDGRKNWSVDWSYGYGLWREEPSDDGEVPVQKYQYPPG